MHEQIGRISFVSLDGDPPEAVSLDPLPSREDVASVVSHMFKPFCMDEQEADVLVGACCPLPPQRGIHVIYVYGHAWLSGGQPGTASRVGDKTLIETGKALVERLLSGAALQRTVLILDCCHAAAFDSAVREFKPRLVVYASGADESAIALHGDKASRLALAVSDELAKSGSVVDLGGAVAAAARGVDKDSVLRGQRIVAA